MGKIVKGHPPNWEIIKCSSLHPNDDTVFAFGDIVYNPSGRKLYPDLIEHESVHFEQQKRFGSPDSWWFKYIHDREFRLNQEIEAYGKQLFFLKEKIKDGKAIAVFLDEMAQVLSSDLYNLDVTHNEAKCKIKLMAKNL